MKKQDYYTSGQFAKMAHVSVRTIRFYDKQDILKPTYVDEHGSRYYSDSDFARLQQILLLKYLGFSLEEIRSMTIDDTDYQVMQGSLRMQQNLIRDRIEQMQLVEKAIRETLTAIQKYHHVDWNQMLELIHLTNMETSLQSQYLNASNISARISLHQLYSENRQGWFPWIFAQCDIAPGMEILEIGCGNGALWTQNLEKIPEDIHVTLSDISEGMLWDARRDIGSVDARFSYQTFDAADIPLPDHSVDLVIAGHLLFYCDVDKVCGEVARVLKTDGRFVCSTYGSHHMEEIDQLVKAFDERIVLSAEKLYDRFGLQNGGEQLLRHFPSVEQRIYPDRLVVDRAEPLMEYILSCHGNQNQYILNRYREFREFVSERTANGFSITKEAGIFVCSNG